MKTSGLQLHLLSVARLASLNFWSYSTVLWFSVVKLLDNNGEGAKRQVHDVCRHSAVEPKVCQRPSDHPAGQEQQLACFILCSRHPILSGSGNVADPLKLGVCEDKGAPVVGLQLGYLLRKRRIPKVL